MNKWDSRFMALARLVASWSKDPSTQVGAAIIDARKRIVSVGFNGAPVGVDEPTCREQKLRRTIHAEANALHFAGRDVTGCSLYVTHPPCAGCAAHIIQRGIKCVVYPTPPIDFAQRWMEEYMEALQMFREAGVTVCVLD